MMPARLDSGEMRALARLCERFTSASSSAYSQAKLTVFCAVTVEDGDGHVLGRLVDEGGGYFFTSERESLS